MFLLLCAVSSAAVSLWPCACVWLCVLTGWYRRRRRTPRWEPRRSRAVWAAETIWAAASAPWRPSRPPSTVRLTPRPRRPDRVTPRPAGRPAAPAESLTAWGSWPWWAAALQRVSHMCAPWAWCSNRSVRVCPSITAVSRVSCLCWPVLMCLCRYHSLQTEIKRLTVSCSVNAWALEEVYWSTSCLFPRRGNEQLDLEKIKPNDCLLWTEEISEEYFSRNMNKSKRWQTPSSLNVKCSALKDK